MVFCLIALVSFVSIPLQVWHGFETYWILFFQIDHLSLLVVTLGKTFNFACMTVGSSLLCGCMFLTLLLSTIATESLLYKMVKIQKADKKVDRKFPLKYPSNGLTEKRDIHE